MKVSFWGSGISEDLFIITLHGSLAGILEDVLLQVSKESEFPPSRAAAKSRLFCGPCSVDVPELLSLLHIAPNLIKQQHIALLRSPTGGRKEEWTSLRAMLPRAAAGRPEWLAGS